MVDHKFPNTGVSINGATPRAGWFVSWNIPSWNGWWLGVPLWLRKPPGAEPKNKPPTNLLDLLEVFVYPNYGAMGAYRIFRKNQLVMLVNDWIYDIGISRTCHGILNGLFMADHITTTNNHLFRGRSCRHAGLLKSSHVGRKWWISWAWNRQT